MTDLRAGIVQITGEIWRTVLAREVVESQATLPPGPTMTCVIHVEGSWEGAVVLRCASDLAGLAAARMLGTPGPPPPDDVQDALGELTNMLAGNIKALLPGHCHIGLPVVAEGSDYQVRMLGTRTVAEVPFATDDGMFTVAVLQQSEEG